MYVNVNCAVNSARIGLARDDDSLEDKSLFIIFTIERCFSLSLEKNKNEKEEGE